MIMNDKDLGSKPVESIMNRPVYFINENEFVYQAVEKMIKNKVKKSLVIDSEKNPKGEQNWIL